MDGDFISWKTLWIIQWMIWGVQSHIFGLTPISWPMANGLFWRFTWKCPEWWNALNTCTLYWKAKRLKPWLLIKSDVHFKIIWKNQMVVIDHFFCQQLIFEHACLLMSKHHHWKNDLNNNQDRATTTSLHATSKDADHQTSIIVGFCEDLLAYSHFHRWSSFHIFFSWRLHSYTLCCGGG